MSPEQKEYLDGYNDGWYNNPEEENRSSLYYFAYDIGKWDAVVGYYDPYYG